MGYWPPWPASPPRASPAGSATTSREERSAERFALRSALAAIGSLDGGVEEFREFIPVVLLPRTGLIQRISPFPPHFGALEHCPGCGSAKLTTVIAAERTNLRCGACGAYWHLELGRIARVGEEPHVPTLRVSADSAQTEVCRCASG